MNYSLDELRAIPVFFIVGKGRSGTTLLSLMLDAHPEVASSTESRFALMLYQKYKNLREWKPEMAQELIKGLDNDYHLKYLWSFKENFQQALEALPPETKVQDLIKMVHLYKETPFQKGKVKFIFDKNPQYTLFIDKLGKIFPDSKFLRLIRDPRDNFTSHKKHTKRKAHYLGFKWLKYNELFDRNAIRKPANFLTLRFEDLIEDPSTFCKELEKFTQLYDVEKHEAKRITNKGKIEKRFNDKLKDQHQASVKPLNKKKIGHYKTLLTEDQIAILNKIDFPYAANYGYENDKPQKRVGLKEQLSTRLSFFLHKLSNKILYNIPYNLMIKVHSWALKYVTKNKKNKLEGLNSAK